MKFPRMVLINPYHPYSVHPKKDATISDQKPQHSTPRANPSSKGTSLISRLPLHYIILLDQEFITMET